METTVQSNSINTINETIIKKIAPIPPIQNLVCLYCEFKITKVSVNNSLNPGLPDYDCIFILF